MHLRKLVVLAAVAFSFTGAWAEEAPKAKAKADAQHPPKATGAKAGEACKTNADCDQSGSAMICGRGKCEYDVTKMPVKT
jgi:hypothetical protein